MGCVSNELPAAIAADFFIILDGLQPDSYQFLAEVWFNISNAFTP